MNNDSTPAPAEGSLPPASPSGSVSNGPAHGTSPPREQQREQRTFRYGRTQKRAHARIRKKNEFIGSLLTNLDILIYAELCILYYMDCSLFRLLIRALPHMTFLSPKPSFLPAPALGSPYIAAIFGPNVLCVLLHIFTSRSEAGESMRGYLHGGIIVDLIGYKGPTSKLHLLLLDILVMALQCVMLAVHAEKQNISAILAAMVRLTTPGDQPRPEPASSQNHDAEEQGVRRGNLADDGDIEMVTLSGIESEEDPDRTRLLEGSLQQVETDDEVNALDAFWAGSVIVADFYVFTSIRKHWADYNDTSISAMQINGLSAGYAAVTTNRRINAVSQRLQRGVETLGG